MSKNTERDDWLMMFEKDVAAVLPYLSKKRVRALGESVWPPDGTLDKAELDRLVAALKNKDSASPSDRPGGGADSDREHRGSNAGPT